MRHLLSEIIVGGWYGDICISPYQASHLEWPWYGTIWIMNGSACLSGIHYTVQVTNVIVMCLAILLECTFMYGVYFDQEICNCIDLGIQIIKCTIVLKWKCAELRQKV